MPQHGAVTAVALRHVERLVGAAHTQFAKPWRREIHVNGLSFPHPVIKHELVHAMMFDLLYAGSAAALLARSRREPPERRAEMEIGDLEE